MAHKEVINISTIFSANIANVNNGIKAIRQNLDTLKLPSGLEKNFLNLLSKLDTEMSNFEAKTKDGLGSKLDSRALEKSGRNILELYRQLQVQVKALGTLSNSEFKKMFPDSFGDNIAKSTKALSDYAKETKKTTGEIQKQSDALAELQKKQKNIESQAATLSKKKANTTDAAYNILSGQTKTARTSATKASNRELEVQRQIEVAKDSGAKVTKTGNLDARVPANKELIESLKQAQEEAKKTMTVYEDLRQKLSTSIPPSQIDDEQQKVQSELNKTKSSIDEVKQTLSELESSSASSFDELKATLSEITGLDFSNIKQGEEGFQQLASAINSIQTGVIDDLKGKIDQLENSTEGVAPAIENIKDGMEDAGKAVDDLTRREEDIGRLKAQILDFFSIGNAIQLFKRAVTSAFETVKDLDAVMTETAVVTEFSVGDMWSQLPQYTKRANELGVSIKSAYEAATLYYQQGLKTNQVIGISNETLKMARIANIEAADATNLMTAALRGFNMAVNEANARNVNDVYSNLAAITAADTEEIGIAMSKTASIAKSANMEFNTTAALLAQIIETTREAPETAGTAMKTIIARFTEVKKLISQGDLMGTDEEGEVIDVNKIDTALKTVGISLKGFLQGTEGIDDIFLKLASKWDTLDISTQRYIATMAAGSRQQSRFLAMMGDYERTMELVGEANNSAGASQKQFEKTLDSMESKLAKLKNAWDEFVMGLANNEAIKFFVGALTGLLNVINSITNALSGGGGLSKAFISFAAVLGGFKLGKSILDKNGGILGLLGGKEKVVGGATNAGSMASVGFTTGFKDKINKTKGFFKGFTKQGIKEIKASSLKLKGEYDKALKDMEAAQERLEKAKTERERVDNIEVTGSPEERKKQGGEKGRASAAANKELAAATDEVAAANKRVADAGNELAPVTETVQDGFNQAGAAAAGAGVAFNLLAGLLDSMGADDSTVELFTNIGTALMIVGAIMPIVGKVFVATGGEVAAAGFAAQAGWWWVLAIIAALAVLVAVAVSAAKAAKAASLAGQLEKAEKATENAKEAAEKAKQAYDELLGEKNKYTELQSSLENLTKGTNAWKQALMDANAQVLNLLATYSKLAQYVSRGEDGQLVISDDGWDFIIKEQEAAVKRTQSAVMSSQVSESRLKEQILDRNYKEKFKSNQEIIAMNRAKTVGARARHLTGAATRDAYQNAATRNAYRNRAGARAGAGARAATRGAYQKATTKGKGVVEGSGSDSDFIYDADIIDKINDGLSNIGEGKTFSDLEAFYASLTGSTGKTREELEELVAATNDYNAALLENEVQLQAQAEAALQAGASEEFLNSQYSDSVTQGFAKQMSTTDYSEQEKAASKAIYTNSKGEDAARKKYMEEELDIRSSGDELKDLELIYKELAGLQSLDEIPEDLRGNKQALADAIGVLQTSTGQIEKMEDFQKRLNNVGNKDTARNIAGLMSGDASQFTIGQLGEVKNLSYYAESLGYAADGEEMATALGYSTKTLSELEQEDQQAFAKIQVVRPDGMSDENYQKAIDDWIAKNGTVSVTAKVQMDIDGNQYTRQMLDAYDKASAELQAKGIKEDSYKNLLMETVSNLSKQTENMSNEAAQNYVANFNKVLESSNLGESGTKQLENYLSSVDWTSMTDAVNAMDYMQNAGVDPTVMKQYWDSAVSGAHTFVSTLAEALSLIDRLQKKMSGVSGIAERLAEGSGTYEDMNALIAAGADISGFQLTAKGWRATTEAIETATGTMRAYYAEQAKETAEQNRKEFTAAQDLASDDSTTFGRAVDYDGANGTVTSSKDFADFDDEDILNLQEELQVEGYNEEKETFDEYLARLEQAYNDKIAQLENGDENQLLLDKSAAYQYASQYTADESALRGESDETVRYSMQHDAETAGLDSTEVTESSEALEELGIQSQQVRDRLALDIALASKAAEEITSNYEDWGAAIEDGPANPKYASSLQALTKSTSQLLGVSEDVAANLLKEKKNRDLVAAAANGDINAYQEIQKIAAKETIAQLDLDNFRENADEINSTIDSLISEDIEVGATLDSTQFGSALYDLLEASGATVDDINTAFESIGWEPEVKYKEVPFSEAQRMDLETTQEVLVPDGVDDNGVPKYKKTTMEAAQSGGMNGGTMVRIPILGDGTVSSVKDSMLSASTFKGKAPGAPKSSKKGGGGGGKKEKWENPYDELYNLTEKANEALRQREKIERDYDRLLKNREATSKQILANSLKEIANLQKEIALQKQLQAGRSSQISKLGSETFKDEKGNEKSFSDWGVTKYASYDETTGTITIDWEAINKITDTEIGAAVEEYISKLEELSEQFEETQDTIEDMEDTLREIQERGKTEYVDFEQRIYDALVAKDQEVIDNLSEINDSINDSNARLLDSIQTAIDEQRQARERDEQRNDIEEKQRRLALLKSDTSGANALEIKKLEEEIGDLQQSYTDSLVDDSLAQLQQQNDDAAEQRERQIEIMQNQLDYAAENGVYWEEVSNLLSTAFNPDGSLNNNSALIDLLKETEGFKALSEFGGMQWIDELIESWLVAQEGLANWKIEKAKQNTNGVQTQNAGTLKYDSATGLWNDTSGGTYSTLAYDPATGQYTASGYTPQTSAPAPTPSSAPAPAVSEETYKRKKRKIKDPIAPPHIQEEFNTHRRVAGVTRSRYTTYTRQKLTTQRYKHGGLADFTGPAWMDGTKAHPELVLKGQDTQNFIALKEILSDILSMDRTPSQNNRDNYFEIHIEVDKLENDYDVEQVAEKVKRIINEDARYRNVNAINVLR